PETVALDLQNARVELGFTRMRDGSCHIHFRKPRLTTRCNVHVEEPHALDQQNTPFDLALDTSVELRPEDRFTADLQLRVRQPVQPAGPFQSSGTLALSLEGALSDVKSWKVAGDRSLEVTIAQF